VRRPFPTTNADKVMSHHPKARPRAGRKQPYNKQNKNKAGRRTGGRRSESNRESNVSICGVVRRPIPEGREFRQSRLIGTLGASASASAPCIRRSCRCRADLAVTSTGFSPPPSRLGSAPRSIKMLHESGCPLRAGLVESRRCPPGVDSVILIGVKTSVEMKTQRTGDLAFTSAPCFASKIHHRQITDLAGAANVRPFPETTPRGLPMVIDVGSAPLVQQSLNHLHMSVERREQGIVRVPHLVILKSSTVGALGRWKFISGFSRHPSQQPMIIPCSRPAGRHSDRALSERHRVCCRSAAVAASDSKSPGCGPPPQKK